MPYAPFNYGNAIAQAEGIQGSRMKNALMQEQLNALQNPQAEGPNIGTYNPRDYTADSWSRFVQTKDPSILERFATLRPSTRGGVPGLVNVISGEWMPGGTLDAETSAAEAMKAAERRGALEQDLVYKPMIESATITSGLEAQSGLGGGPTAADVAGNKARSETVAREQAGRGQEWINRAASASEAYPVIGRALQLLNKVDTGGVDSVKLAASNFFGVTGADEAELSNNLGKAVLSQLRETFGAAFTVEEGKRLERIEANYGKSTEGNKRLLKQTQKILDNVMRRGLKAAQDTGDQAAIDAIKSGYTFDLSTQPETGADVDFSTLSDEELRAILEE